MDRTVYYLNLSVQPRSQINRLHYPFYVWGSMRPQSNTIGKERQFLFLTSDLVYLKWREGILHILFADCSLFTVSTFKGVALVNGGVIFASAT